MNKKIRKNGIDTMNDKKTNYDSTPAVEENLDEPLEDAFDISEGGFNIFETADYPDDQEEDSADIIQGEHYNTFSLAENIDEDPEDVFDIMSGEYDEERFPLTSSTEHDNKKQLGKVGEFISQRSPVKPSVKKNGGLIIALAICSALIIFLLWTLFGVLYTNNYNEYLYEEYHHGIDVKYINPDFVFFVTIGEKSLPVIESDSPNYYKTVNGKFFSPGTLTTSDGSTVTGSSRLLPAFDSSLIGKTVTTESQLQKTEYEIYSIGEYTPQNSSEEFVIYIEDSSSSTGYTALFAKPSK